MSAYVFLISASVKNIATARNSCREPDILSKSHLKNVTNIWKHTVHRCGRQWKAGINGRPHRATLHPMMKTIGFLLCLTRLRHFRNAIPKTWFSLILQILVNFCHSKPSIPHSRFLSWSLFSHFYQNL